jgi:hypothetical protein
MNGGARIRWGRKVKGGLGKGTNEGITKPRNVGSEKCKVNGCHT